MMKLSNGKKKYAMLTNAFSVSLSVNWFLKMNSPLAKGRARWGFLMILTHT